MQPEHVAHVAFNSVGEVAGQPGGQVGLGGGEVLVLLAHLGVGVGVEHREVGGHGPLGSVVVVNGVEALGCYRRGNSLGSGSLEHGSTVDSCHHEVAVALAGNGNEVAGDGLGGAIGQESLHGIGGTVDAALSGFGTVHKDVDVVAVDRHCAGDCGVDAQIIAFAGYYGVELSTGVGLGCGVFHFLGADEGDGGRRAGLLKTAVICADGALDLELLADGHGTGVEGAAHVHEDGAAFVGKHVALAADCHHNAADCGVVALGNAAEHVGGFELNGLLGLVAGAEGGFLSGVVVGHHAVGVDLGVNIGCEQSGDVFISGMRGGEGCDEVLVGAPHVLSVLVVGDSVLLCAGGLSHDGVGGEHHIVGEAHTGAVGECEVGE